MLHDSEFVGDLGECGPERLPAPVGFGAGQHQQVAPFDLPVTDRGLRPVDLGGDAVHELQRRPIDAVVVQGIGGEAHHGGGVLAADVVGGGGAGGSRTHPAVEGGDDDRRREIRTLDDLVHDTSVERDPRLGFS